MCSTPNGTCTAHQLTGSLSPENTAFFNSGQLVTTNDNYFTIRVDHKISDQDMLNGTYFFDRTPQLSPDTLLDINTPLKFRRRSPLLCR